jgi:hypothetical protein
MILRFRFVLASSSLAVISLTLGGCFGTDGDGGGSSSGGTTGRGGSSSSAGGTGGAARGGSAGDAGSAGVSGGGSAGTASGGTSGSETGGSGGATDPTCTSIDSNGFFADCAACGDDCDTIDDGSGTRYACGCGSGCPCGLSCGCYEIAPSVTVCDICVR